MTKKDVIELIGGIIITLILVVMVTTTYAYLNKHYIESTNETLDLKAYCNSIDGSVGGDKCYKDGKEMFFGGEE